MFFDPPSCFVGLLCCLQFSVTIVTGNRLDNRTKVEDFLNVCMLGQSHKVKPSPEASLYKSCQRYRANACCHSQTTVDMHQQPTWYKFSWNHCDGHNLSEKCHQHFLDDLCFYECSPNVGPWLVAGDRHWQKERFISVPLCKSSCTAWWEDCKDDYTCRDNWYKGFDWSSGTNKCKEGWMCRTFKEMFGSAEKMCENIWDGSWKVVPDSDQCMHIRWTAGDNPNAAVAAARANELVGSLNGAGDIKPWCLSPILVSAVFCTLHM